MDGCGRWICKARRVEDGRWICKAGGGLRGVVERSFGCWFLRGALVGYGWLVGVLVFGELRRVVARWTVGELVGRLAVFG